MKENDIFMDNLRTGLYGGLSNNDGTEDSAWDYSTMGMGGVNTQVGNVTPPGIDFSGMLGNIGGLFSAGKGETSVMGGLAPWAQMGMTYLMDKKNDTMRANNATIQRQQIASNTYNADKRKRNDLALGKAFGTA